MNATVTLHEGREKSLLRHHPWIFSKAVAAVTDGARLFYVYQGDNGLHWFTATYDFYPQIVDYSGNGGGTFGLESLRPGEDTVEGYYFHPYTEAAFAALVESTGCEYLYLDKVDDLFRESYGGLFSDGLAAAERLCRRYPELRFCAAERDIGQL